MKPKKGRALVWNNMDSAGECDPTSVHQAVKVIRGQKIILQRWYFIFVPQHNSNQISSYLIQQLISQPHVTQNISESMKSVFCRVLKISDYFAILILKTL